MNMSGSFIPYAYPVLILLLSLFFIYRLKRGDIGRPDRQGTGFIYAGLILCFFFAVATLVQQWPGYEELFLEWVYPVLEIAMFSVLALGLIFFVIGIALHFSAWGDRLGETENYLEKLQLLEHVQYQCRQPYPTVELLDRVLALTLKALDEDTGAVFLFVPQEEQFNLVSARGLTDEEKELLRHYPHGRNIITEAIEKRTALVTADFRSFGGKAQLALTKFRTLAVFPLVSGKSRLGALVLFSPEENRYTEDFLIFLAPLVGWLSEKLEVARLSRDLRQSIMKLENSSAESVAVFRKLERITDTLAGSSNASDFAAGCIGLVEATEAWLLGLEQGRLKFYGGTTSPESLTDRFKSALVDALAKGKTVVLNQEETRGQGQSQISRSSVLLPTGTAQDALLLVRKGGPMVLSENSLKILAIFAALAGMIIRGEKEQAISRTRRQGFDSVTQSLRFPINGADFEDNLKRFVKHIAGVNSPSAIVVLYRREANNLVGIYATLDTPAVNELSLVLGEGGSGRAAALKLPEAAFGHAGVSRYLMPLNEENLSALRTLLGERQTPVFMGDYPVLIDDQTGYLITVFDFEESPGGDPEKHQLLAVMIGLYNLRLEIHSIRQAKAKLPPVSMTFQERKILTVADQPVISDLLSSMCRSLGYDVLVAAEGNEGLALFEKNHPGVVVIDLATTASSGEVETSDLAHRGLGILEMSARMKEISADVTIIGLAGWGISLDQERLRRAGIEHILRKPFRLEQLAELLDKPRNIIKN